MNIDQEYVNLIKEVMEKGDNITTRNSKVKRLFAKTLTIDSTPLISIRKTSWKSALYEMEWFLSGSEYVKDLKVSVQPWWQPWANKDGNVLFNYSRQFRHYTGVDLVETEHGGFRPVVTMMDQIGNFLKGIQNHPYSRRNLLTTWNPVEMTSRQCPITNCHNTITQAFVEERGTLSLVTYQRSCDVICGLPHNLIQMAAFHAWLCARTKRTVGKLVWIGGDVHIYEQHFNLVNQMIERVGECRKTPTLVYYDRDENFKAKNFELDGEYVPILNVKAEMVV